LLIMGVSTSKFSTFHEPCYAQNWSKMLVKLDSSSCYTRRYVGLRYPAAPCV
jgi:hypothetical protein